MNEQPQAQQAQPQPQEQPQPVPAPQPVMGPTAHDTMQALIPTQNKPALFSYYFGIFGLIPLLGLALSVVAVILGVIGLNKVKQNPTPGAKTHAMIGLILGCIELTVFVIFLTMMIVRATSY